MALGMTVDKAVRRQPPREHNFRGLSPRSEHATCVYKRIFIIVRLPRQVIGTGGTSKSASVGRFTMLDGSQLNVRPNYRGENIRSNILSLTLSVPHVGVSRTLQLTYDPPS